MSDDYKLMTKKNAVINIFTIVLMLVAVLIVIHEDNKRIAKIREVNKQMYNELIDTQIALNTTMKHEIEKSFLYKNVTITAYSPSREETDSTPNKTAIMTKPIPGKTCAVSRDLLNLLGKKIYIEGYGVFEATDVMNKRWTHRIDLCMGKKEAINFGIHEANVVLLNPCSSEK